jgi:opacity protein-like surface antigen
MHWGKEQSIGHYLDFLLGLESDLDWADISGSGAVAPSGLGVLLGSTLNMSTKIDWIGTARARAGYAQDNWLFYATGGVALADAKTNLTAVAGPLCSTIGQPVCSASSRKAGAALGVGVEYGLQEVSAIFHRAHSSGKIKASAIRDYGRMHLIESHGRAANTSGYPAS